MTQTGNLGALLVSIESDASDLEKGLKKAEDKVKQFQKESNSSFEKFKIVGLAAATTLSIAFVKLANDTLEYGAQLHQLSVQTGMTAQEIARLQYIAGQTDASFEGVTSSVKFLSRAMYEAVNGNQEFRQLFNRLGVDLVDSNGKLRKATDVLFEMGPALQKVGNETEMVAIGQKLLGRSFQENIGFFKASRAEMDALREKNIGATDRLNEFAKASDEVTDKMAEMSASFKNASAGFFLPFLQWVVDILPKVEKFVGRLEEMRQKLVEIGAINYNPEKNPASVASRNSALLKGEDAARILANRQAVIDSAYGGTSPGAGTFGVTEGSLPAAAGQAGSPGLAAQGAGNAAMRAPADYYLGSMQQENPWAKMQQDMEAFNEKFFNFQDEAAKAWQTTMSTFVSSFGQAFVAMGAEGAKFSDAMKGLWEDMKRAILQAIGQMIAKWLAFMALKAVAGPFGGFLPFRQGGAILQAREGLAFSAADNFAVTPSFGERGIPVMAHPNEAIMPLDKLFGLAKSMQGDTINIYPSGRAADDPAALAELLAIEKDRRSRRP